jgi:UDP-3-O-[3-hydroxymyristoyl] glucosamine N-acyltransferase
MQYTLSEIARIVGGVVQGDATVVVKGVASVDDTQPHDITLALDNKRLAIAHSREQAAIIIPPQLCSDCQVARSYLVATDPRRTFSGVLGLFDPGVHVPEGVSPRAHVSEEAVLEDGVRVGPGAYVGPGSHIGRGTVLFPGVYIGAHVKIGRDCTLMPNCVIMDRCEIHDRVLLHAGCVVGADGFGYIFDGERHVKMPQIGGVVIEDDVEVGANTCIDRSTTGVTVIGRGTKIDNLVHVAHNVKIGQACILAGQSGIAGSSTLGERCVLGGQVGISDHTTVGARSTVMGKSVVAGKLSPDSVVSGIPARDHRTELRVKAAARRLPDLMEQVERLERRLQQLESQQANCRDQD